MTVMLESEMKLGTFSTEDKLLPPSNKGTEDDLCSCLVFLSPFVSSEDCKLPEISDRIESAFFLTFRKN